jgi:hypothetical protein
VRVVEEVQEWQRHSLEQLKSTKDFPKHLSESEVEAVDD